MSRITPTEEPRPRVLVTGGRDLTDRKLVFSALNELEPRPLLVIAGGATGTDTLAEMWCNMSGIPLCVFPALWSSHGRAAGPYRNQWMLDFGQPDLIVAFPGNKGTADMVKRGKKAGVDIVFYGIGEGNNHT